MVDSQYKIMQGAVTATPDCPPQSATIVLGPSTMENGGVEFSQTFEPCILTDGRSC